MLFYLELASALFVDKFLKNVFHQNDKDWLSKEVKSMYIESKNHGLSKKVFNDCQSVISKITPS